MTATDLPAESTGALAAEEEFGEYRSLWSDVWRQFRKHKGAMAGLFILAFIMLAVYIGPFFYPYDPFELDLENLNQGPSGAHLLGTDNVGRDVLARVLVGGRISMSVGIAAMLVGIVIGTAVGVLSGYFKPLDGPLMRLTDLFIAIPQLPALLVIVVLFREPLKESFGARFGVFLLVVTVIGIFSWMQTARIVRGDVLAAKQEDYVTAALSLGTRRRSILARHILPNVLSAVMVASSLGVATAIITESALSFLGLGFPQDLPTWGVLLSLAKDYMQINPWRTIAPGVLISLTVLCVNFIGDGLRDALDPKLRSKG